MAPLGHRRNSQAKSGTDRQPVELDRIKPRRGPGRDHHLKAARANLDRTEADACALPLIRIKSRESDLDHRHTLKWGGEWDVDRKIPSLLRTGR